MKVAIFHRLNRIADGIYFPAIGINPFDALMASLLGERELKLARRNDTIPERLVKRVKYFSGKLSYRLFRSSTRRKVRKASVVFFISEPTHQKQCVPVARELLKKGCSVAVISTKKAFRDPWKKIRVPFVYMHPSFLIPPYAVLSKNEEFLRLIEDELEEKEFRQVKSKVHSQVPSIAALSVELKKYIADDVAKQLWFFGNDLAMYGRVAAQTIRRAGIRTLSIQHGTIPDDPIHSFHLVDVMMVFGEISKKRLLEKGMPESRIHITGAPYTDELLKSNRHKQTVKILDHLQLETEYEKRVLIVFSGPGHRTSELHHMAMISAVLMLAKQFTDYEFIFKLHRKDKVLYYLNAAQGINLSNVRLVAHNTVGVSSDIFDWFSLVPLIITGNSAAGSEALLMGKTVFTIDLMEEYKGVDYRDAGVSIHSGTERELLENFRDYTLNRFGDAQLLKSRHFNEQYFYKTDGESALRCAELIVNLLPQNLTKA